MSKRSLGKKAFTVVRKLGHKSTQVLGKLGAKAVDVATSKAANFAGKVKQKYGSDKVTAIGHSLGGGLAASSGIKKELLTIKQLD